jgi:hypothetical protein
MTVRELEQKVLQTERILILIRDSSTARTKDYPYRRGARENWSTTNLKKNRIEPLLDGKEVLVLDGKGRVPHGKTLLRTLRESYN